MAIAQIIRIDNAKIEAIALSKYDECPSINEWVDGTNLRDFTPSADAKSFAGFPYYLIVNDESELSWASNQKEFAIRLLDEISDTVGDEVAGS